MLVPVGMLVLSLVLRCLRCAFSDLPNNDEAKGDAPKWRVGIWRRTFHAQQQGHKCCRSKRGSCHFSSRAMCQEARYTTERLTVAPWRTPLSAAELKELDGILDVEVTAFLPPHLLYEPGTSDVSKWASTFSAGGSSVSSVRLLGTNELCGLILLRPETSSVHLGYIFGKQHWGKGLATELLRGLMDQLTVQRHVGEIHAGVDRHNPASAAVLRKVGFSAMGAGTNGDKSKDMDWYYRKFDGK